jgi:D-alanyl-D-alanine carboxypeptidase
VLTLYPSRRTVDRPRGTLAFNNFPELDHNYADTGFPGGAVVKGSDPLAALNELAASVRAAGIREVRGDVVIDDRLFATYDGWPDGVIAPIWVNENVIDITTTPTAAGRPATVNWRPNTASLRIESQVTTVAAEKQTASLRIEATRPDVVRVTGEIAADSKPILNIWRIRNPANFARTAFIEALQRADVKVSATPTGSNPVQILPPGGAYAQNDKVAEHVSPPLSEYVKVILKVSYNRGADLMLGLAAVKSGSRDCTAGLDAALKLITSIGVTPMMVNENLLDVWVVPTAAGQAAQVDWRPKTAAFSVDGSVQTVPAGTPAAITLSGNGKVAGEIPIAYKAPLSGSPTFVGTFRIEDPASYARIAFIQALTRAGVIVRSPTSGKQRAGKTARTKFV